MSLGLLKAAIRDPDPVVFLENEMVYGVQYPVSDQVLDKEFVLPIGKAKVQRAGKHVTIVAHSRPVEAALAAANELAGSGIEAEVINLRSVRPLDVETICKSIQKTNHLVTVEGGWPQCGMCSMIRVPAFIPSLNAFSDLYRNWRRNLCASDGTRNLLPS